jgi:disulfide bond formation protein DsbB
MSEDAKIATEVLVYATVGIDILVLALVLFRTFFQEMFERFSSRWNLCGRCLAALVAITALSGSMFYSAVTGFAGCALCLASRIIMGALVIVLASPLLKSVWDARARVIGIALSLLGLLVSGYQYALQWLALTGTHLPCPALEGLPSCGRIYFVAFGFITIPFVAFSAFALILTLLLVLRKKDISNVPLA